MRQLTRTTMKMLLVAISVAFVASGCTERTEEADPVADHMWDGLPCIMPPKPDDPYQVPYMAYC